MNRRRLILPLALISLFSIFISCSDDTEPTLITEEDDFLEEIISLEERKQTFIGRNGGELAVALNTNIKHFVVEVPDEAKDWLSFVQADINNKEIIFSVKPNNHHFRWTMVKIANSTDTLSVDAFIGQLSSANQDVEKCYYIEGGDMKDIVPIDAEEIILFGSPDRDDFRYMRDKVNKLSTLDLNGTTITEIPDNAFYDPAKFKHFFTKISFPETLKRIGNHAFRDCYNLRGNLNLPDGLITIGEYAFYQCLFFTGSLRIPNSVTSIGEFAFSGCTGLTGDLIYPANLVLLGRHSFPSSLSGDLIISEGTTVIPAMAFANHRNIKGKLVIPSSVMAIGAGAFFGCLGINEVYCYNKVPLEISDIWENTNPDKKLYVPRESVETYKAIESWAKAFNDGKNIFGMP